MVGFPENCQAPHRGHRGPQQLQLLHGQVRTHLGKSRDISSWVSEAGDVPGAHRVVVDREHDRDRGCRLPGGLHIGRARRHDDVDPKGDELRGQPGQSLGVPVIVPGLEHEIHALAVSEVTERRSKRGDARRCVESENANLVDLPRLLSLDDARSEEEAGDHGAKEHPPVHRSSVWLAGASALEQEIRRGCAG